MTDVGKAIRDWWHVVTAIIVVVLAFGKLFWDVENLKTADDRALLQRLEAVERRTDDTALTDWNRWRATVDAKLVGIEVDIRDLRNRAP